MKGTIKWFDKVKNYGFIAGEDNIDYFVHGSELQDDVVQDDAVEFEPVQGEKGDKATKVSKI